MKLGRLFRKATKRDARRMAELYQVSSDGVADYVWSTLESPGLSPLEIGERRYAMDDIDFSYKNCIVAEKGGEVVGILVAFPVAETQDEAGQGTGEAAPAEAEEIPDVLMPYAELEAPGTYYICAMAVLPEYRNQGLGTEFLSIARAQARERGIKALSLLTFEQNGGAMRFYERNGFHVVDRRRVVPHELIRYEGDVVLMVADV